ncbi:MAG: c-type cytochrome [Gammaproteobacteria bacterium]|nr:c-type cytochrome [Gammaproteobacteria bacterium]
MAAFGSVHAAPDGLKLYTKHCSVCHNENGIGGIGLPLNSYKVESFPRDYLLKTIRLGREGRVMPAFKKLSDAQVNAIVDYLLSWKKTTIEVVFSDTPVDGNPVSGKLLFEHHCAECHGMDGKSEGIGTGVSLSREREFQVIPPALNNPGFLGAANDQWIRHTVVNGRAGTIMPSQKKLKLSNTEVDNIVSYLRSFEAQSAPLEKHQDEKPTLIFDSPYDFTTTIGNIKRSLQGLNFRYFPDRYMEMGLIDDKEVNKKQLSLRFCNFNLLYEMINIEPRLGVVLPCSVTVVEGDDGQVKLYVMNMKVVSRVFNNAQLTEAAEKMHLKLMELIDEATL